jgi:hypothetical protein
MPILNELIIEEIK